MFDMVKCYLRPIQRVFPPDTQRSWDRFQIKLDTDWDKAHTEEDRTIDYIWQVRSLNETSLDPLLFYV